MAVEKQRVIGRLKVLFPKANLTKERINAIAERLAKRPEDGATDDAIDAVINEFNENSLLTIEDIAREDDRQRGIQARLDKLGNGSGTKGESDDDDDDESDDDDDGARNGSPQQNKKKQKSNDDTPQWAKALMEKVDNIEKGKVTDTKKQTATQLFEKSEVLKGLKPELKERWLARIDVNSDVSLEDQIEGLETEYSELVQINADNTSYAGPAGSGSANAKPDDTIVNEIVDNLNI